jgi:hypothetical protein
LSAEATVTEDQKLDFWEGCLDETSKKLFRLKRRESKGDLTFSEEIEQMRMKYARDLGIGARKRWEDTFLPLSGKVTQNEWRDFEADFKTAWGEVKDSTPGEARRILI